MALSTHSSGTRSLQLSISDLIKSSHLIARYQPIVSLKKQCIIGFETSCYGKHPDMGKEIPLQTLYRLADQQDMFVEFDRHCRSVALEALAVLYKVNPSLQLFLRFESAVLNHGVVGSNYLLDQVRALGIAPQNLVIEVVESSVREDSVLQRFVKAYQQQHFLIGLCGLGKANLRLQRIPLVKPDIVHVEGPLVANLCDPTNQIVVRAVVQLANNMGALVVANGIDSVGAGVVATELGIDMQQGSLYNDPHSLNRHDLLACQARVRDIAASAKHVLTERIQTSRTKRKRFEKLTRAIAEQLNDQPIAESTAILEQIVRQHRDIECLYILDANGLQVADTVCSQALLTAMSGTMFEPAKIFTDQSLKDYYYRRFEIDSELYVSDPYVSLASGNTCITLSLSFRDAVGNDHILCVDVIV